ncbi:MAG: DUF2207 domain-containing protein [Alphaproteobacteria bacterium]
MKLIRFCIVCFFIIGLSFSNAIAEEKILAYDVLIKINEDASIDVNEKIVINVEHKNINLGIFRTIPTIAKTDKRQYKTPVLVNSVTLDGHPENFWIVKSKNADKIEIGPEKFDGTNKLSKGIHIYEISWSSQGHLRSFENFDEIYFNTTGNDWIFPIEVARAVVLLPDNISAIQFAGYYGPKGSTNASLAQAINERTIEFFAQNLDKGDGLTVSVGFSKGINNIQHISAINPIIETIMNLGAPYLTEKSTILLLILITMFAYYLYIWYKYGKDDEIGPITPLFTPSSNISPAEAEVIMKGKRYNEDRAFMASILNLATNKFIKIENKNLIKIEKSEEPKFSEERNILKTAFSKKQKISLGKFNPKFGDAYTAFYTALKKLKKSIIKENSFALKYGLLLNIILFFIVPGAKAMGFAFVLMSVIALFYTPFYFGAFACLKSKSFLSGIFLLLFLIPHSSAFVLFMPYTIVSQIEDMTSIDIVAFFFSAFSLIVMHITFYYLMDKPYPETTKKISQLLGLKMFMVTTEKNRYSQITPAIFEKNLPYAVVFGIENEWIEKMQLLNPTYTPDWYDDSKDFSPSSLSSLASGFSKGATRPSSNSSSGYSSGSSGGGSSGGGSGGGGGGGR